MFEAQLLNAIKEELGITISKYNKTIKLLIKQYIRGEISKQSFTELLKGFAREN